MGAQEAYIAFLNRLPTLASPITKPNFKAKLKWTGICLVLYYILSQITAYGVDVTRLQSLALFELLLGARFGSIMSLGIGPIVTASIILQLVVGSKLINWDLHTETGKIMFQGTQKLAGILLAFVEAVVFVGMGAIPATSPGMFAVVVFQLALGGISVIFMDELISKWGIGSGISLFIVAGVSSNIIAGALNPFATNCSGGARLCLPSANNPPIGRLPLSLFFLSVGDPFQAFLAIMPLIATVVVFFVVVYLNAIKEEIPLAFGSIRGFGRRWPLKFLYTSNIPVILVAALAANALLFARSMANSGNELFGTFNQQGSPTGGLAYLFTAPQSESLAVMMTVIGLFALIGALIAARLHKQPWKFTILCAVLGVLVWFAVSSTSGITSLLVIPSGEGLRAFTYMLFLIIGSVIFSYFWIATSGMDAHAVAGQIEGTGMQIPGYRSDVRVMEQVLQRYIPPLAVMGGAAVGFLSAFADFTGAIGTGTGILLAAMIVYQLYEQIAMEHLQDMHPAMRKFFE